MEKLLTVIAVAVLSAGLMSYAVWRPSERPRVVLVTPDTFTVPADVRNVTVTTWPGSSGGPPTVRHMAVTPGEVISLKR